MSCLTGIAFLRVKVSQMIHNLMRSSRVLATGTMSAAQPVKWSDFADPFTSVLSAGLRKPELIRIGLPKRARTGSKTRRARKLMQR